MGSKGARGFISGAKNEVFGKMVKCQCGGIFVENQYNMPNTIQSIELRNLQIEDYKELKKSMMESYPEMEDSFWKEDQIEILLEKFPEGQLVIVVDGICSSGADIVQYRVLVGIERHLHASAV